MRSLCVSVFVLLFIVATVFAAAATEKQTTVVIDTPYGKIRGFKNAQGSYSFLGIPFAQKMNRSTMFLPPQDLQPWSGVLDALEFQPGCMAKCRGKFSSLMCPAKTSATNCLFTDWYVPAAQIEGILALQQNEKNSKSEGKIPFSSLFGSKQMKQVPVLAFVHGGMSLWGSPSIPLYEGNEWVKRSNLIFVGVGYRLNLWGSAKFSKHFPGNNAMRDMRAAVQLIHKLASSFGGDAQKIVISGQSAGAQMTMIMHAAVPSMWNLGIVGAVPISSPTGLTLPTEKNIKCFLTYVHLVKVLVIVTIKLLQL